MKEQKRVKVNHRRGEKNSSIEAGSEEMKEDESWMQKNETE